MKNLFSLLPVCFFAFTLPSQPIAQWQKALGGNLVEEAYSSARTTDGGYVITGYTLSNNGNIEGNHGGFDIWVCKLSDTGDIQWKKTYGGTDTDWGVSIQQTSDGGYILAGLTFSNDYDVSDNHGDCDAWLVKLNSNGTIEWQKCLGGSNRDEAWSVQQTFDAGYILVGKSNSTNGDVTGNHGGFDFWVVKLNSEGELLWQKSVGGGAEESAYFVRQVADGGYLVVGETFSTDGDVSGNHGNGDYWVVKLRSTGEIEWQKTLGGSYNDIANGVIQTEDGGYIIIGYASSGDGDMTVHYGGYDIWTVKLAESGNLEWEKSYGGSDDDWGASILQTSDGGYVIAGSTQSTDGDVHNNDGILDVWITRLNNLGEILWEKTIGGSMGEFARSLYSTSDNGYFLLATTWSNNGDVSGNHGKSDFWVVKLSPESSPTTSPQPAPLEIYPNPAHQLISVQLPASFSMDIEEEFPMIIQITDLPGRVVMRQVMDSEAPLNIEAIPNGLYMLTATTNSGKVFSGKFVKQE